MEDHSIKRNKSRLQLLLDVDQVVLALNMVFYLSPYFMIESYHNQVQTKMKILLNKIKILREKIDEFKV